MAVIGGFPMIGSTLGHYRIKEKIGQGGMGEVYRARDEHLNRDVAVKVLPAGTLGDEQARKRFRKEAETLSRLNHPHIATIHDFDTQDGTDFLVMEYVTGETLKEKLQAGPLPEKDIAKLGGEIVEALEEAHEHGIIHRDLKPGNIAFTPKGHVKVLDFGIAKLLRSQENDAEVPTVDTLSKTVGRAGTLPYMAPEQLRGEEVDARTDIYALGATLYEAATGRRPFEGSTAEVLIGDIQHKAPRPPRELNSRITEDLGRIILKCLDKDPALRYQSAKELHVDLGRLGRSAPVIEKRTSMTRRLLGVTGAMVLFLALLLWMNIGGLRDRLFGGETTQIDSIAVLPFENVGGDPDTEYLSDGITESLIGKLSQLAGLRVMARSTAYRFKGQGIDPREAGRQMGVHSVLTGRLSKRGEALVVGAELVDVEHGTQLWGERFNRPMTDIFTVEEEISSAIAGKLLPRLSGEEVERLARRSTENSEAYQFYLRGRFFWNQRTAEGLRKGLRYFQQALAEDPTYALAYSGVADSYNMLASYAILHPDEAYPKAKAAARKALEIDDRIAEAHTALARSLHLYDWNWTEAEREFRRAIELNPNYANAHHWLSVLLSSTNRTEEAISETHRAQELDPLSLSINANVGRVYVNAGQFGRAIQETRKAIEIDPQFAWAHDVMGRALVEEERYDEAIREFEKAVELSEGSDLYLMRLGHAYAVSGRKDKALDILEKLKADLEEKFVSPDAFAFLYIGLGENDLALTWLTKAVEDHPSQIITLPVDPIYDPLRDDPRFQDLLHRMNFPE